MTATIKKTKIKKYVAIGDAYDNFWAMGSFNTMKEAANWVSLKSGYAVEDGDFYNVNGTRVYELRNDYVTANAWAVLSYAKLKPSFYDDIRLADKMRKEGKWHEEICEAQS
jgi:hypothetical protein